jgi:hypothetical protein
MSRITNQLGEFLSRLSETLITRVVVWKQFHLNQWSETTLRKWWRATEGGVCRPEDYCTLMREPHSGDYEK